MSLKLKRLLDKIYSTLLETYGKQVCFLENENPFELLVATILSAQCTDKKVNAVTPGLFEKYPDAEAFAKADVADVEKRIKVCGFYHAKAKSIIGSAKKIIDDFGGEVPCTMEELTTLPGVGRKTANVVLGNALGVPGLPVDTHVKRIVNLIGIIESEDPEKIESVLCENLAPERWAAFSHLLIAHGRACCIARRPRCAECVISGLCQYGKKEIKK